jgi:L-galactono-1,4-lactone dehydrogenase
VHEPESVEAVEAVVASHHARGQRLRAVGSGLSPNGIGFCANGGACVNLAAMDRILAVDADKQQVCGFLEQNKTR